MRCGPGSARARRSWSASSSAVVARVAEHRTGLQRGQQPRRRGRGGEQDDDPCRQEAPRAGAVEPREPHRARGLHLAPEQAGDEEAGHDEEDVHPDEPAGQAGDAGVEEDDGQDGDRP